MLRQRMGAAGNQSLPWPCPGATVFGSTWRHSKCRIKEEEAKPAARRFAAEFLGSRCWKLGALELRPRAGAGTLYLRWHWLKARQPQRRRAAHLPKPLPSRQNYHAAEERLRAKNRYFLFPAGQRFRAGPLRENSSAADALRSTSCHTRPSNARTRRERLASPGTQSCRRRHIRSDLYPGKGPAHPRGTARKGGQSPRESPRDCRRDGERLPLIRPRCST